MAKQELFTRVVSGVKDYDWVDPATGERKRVAPGNTIQVTAEQARAFSHVLVDPAVAEAQKAAAAAMRKAEDEAEAAARAARRAPPAPPEGDKTDTKNDPTPPPAAKAGK